MATNYITIKGYVRDGKIEADLPENVIDGEAEITIVVKNEESEPLTGAEIVARGLTGGWKDLGIEDSVAWVKEQKRKPRERHQCRR